MAKWPKFKHRETLEDIIDAMKNGDEEFRPTTVVYSNDRIVVSTEVRGIASETPEVVFLLKVRADGTEFCDKTLAAVLRHWF